MLLELNQKVEPRDVNMLIVDMEMLDIPDEQGIE